MSLRLVETLPLPFCYSKALDNLFLQIEKSSKDKEPDPEPVVEEDTWASSIWGSKKDKKKGKVTVQETTKTKDPEPEPKEVKAVEDDFGWGSFGASKKDKKKKTKDIVEEAPKVVIPEPEPEAVDT